MIQFGRNQAVVVKMQSFSAAPFRCIADKTGELLFEGMLSIDSARNPYILKAEPRMTRRERTRVIEAYKNHLFTKKT